MQGKQMPEDPNNFSYDSDLIVQNGQAKMKGRKIPVVYKGRTYLCIIYPKDAQFSYKIEEDDIIVQYGLEMKIATNTDMLMKPIIFIPAPEIADKCVLPDVYIFSYNHEIEEDGEIRLKNYSVALKDMRNNRKQIVYFLK